MTSQRRPRSRQGRRLKTSSPSTLLDVTIERILPGGLGLAHAEDLTILVSLAAPGDHLRVRVDRTQGRVAFASIEEILSPSEVRVEPPCPYFGRCGGCDFQQLSYAAQLVAKVEIIRDCLRRIAKLDLTQDIPITPSPNIWHYRSRAQWQVDAMRNSFGYFERASHRVCDVASCAVLVPELEATLEALRETMRRGELPTFEVLAVAGDNCVSVEPEIGEFATREVSRTIFDDQYRFGAESFVQINHALLEPLILAATEETSGDTAIDLYCGAGLFTILLAQHFRNVVGVESNPSSVGFASRNLEAKGLNNVHLECAFVSDWLGENGAELAPVDFVLLDPPRSGVEADTISGILALRPRQISYVSCDPATLARDLKGIVAGGYSIVTIAAFDMFPQTHHVETVVRLKRASAH